jgi:hypothetical protein
MAYYKLVSTTNDNNHNIYKAAKLQSRMRTKVYQDSSYLEVGEGLPNFQLLEYVSDIEIILTTTSKST